MKSRGKLKMGLSRGDGISDRGERVVVPGAVS